MLRKPDEDRKCSSEDMTADRQTRKQTGRHAESLITIFSSPIGGVSSWWRGTVVERLSLTGELSLSCARPAADG